MGSSGLYYYGYRFYDPSSQRWLNRDPVGEKDTTHVYAPFRNAPTRWIDPKGLSSQASSPKADLPFWNDPGVCEHNNCYNYALNMPATYPSSPPKSWGRFAQPGDRLGSPRSNGFGQPAPSCSELIRYAESDGLTLAGSCGACPPGTSKIILWTDPSDFHFYRQDIDGSWSHKPGEWKAEPVADPSRYKDYEKCAVLCAPNQPAPSSGDPRLWHRSSGEF